MILDQIAADTRLRVEAKKKEISLEEVKRDLCVVVGYAKR